LVASAGSSRKVEIMATKQIETQVQTVLKQITEAARLLELVADGETVIGDREIAALQDVSRLIWDIADPPQCECCDGIGKVSFVENRAARGERPAVEHCEDECPNCDGSGRG